MENKDVVNVIYFGQDIKTLMVLENEKNIVVKGVAKIGDFLKYKTFNPINRLFQFTYFLHLKEKNRHFKRILNYIFQCISSGSTGLFKKYRGYLNHLVKNEIKIIEYKNVTELQKFVNDQQVILFVVNEWRILPTEVVNMPKFGCINIHPSKLPKYRGALPTLWALKNGDKSSAVTYLVLDDAIDGGNIIAQHEFPILPQDTAISINYKIDNIVCQTLSKDILYYVNDNKKLVQQYKKESTKTEKFHRYRYINFRGERGIDIYNKINFYPYQYPTNKCYAKSKGRKISFLGCRGVVESQTLNPGCYNIHKLNVFIGCKDHPIKFRLFKDINILHSCMIYLKLVQF